MVDVTIYTRPITDQQAECPHCAGALKLLRDKKDAGATIAITDIPGTAEVRSAMEARVQEARAHLPSSYERNKRITFPQMFIGNTYVDGADNLYRLDLMKDAQGKSRLDTLLAGEQIVPPGPPPPPR